MPSQILFHITLKSSKCFVDMMLNEMRLWLKSTFILTFRNKAFVSFRLHSSLPKFTLDVIYHRHIVQVFFLFLNRKLKWFLQASFSVIKWKKYFQFAEILLPRRDCLLQNGAWITWVSRVHFTNLLDIESKLMFMILFAQQFNHFSREFFKMFS